MSEEKAGVCVCGGGGGVAGNNEVVDFEVSAAVFLVALYTSINSSFH